MHFPAGHACLHFIYFNVLIFSLARYTSSAFFNNDNVALLVCRPVPALPLWHAAWSHLRGRTLPIGPGLPLWHAAWSHHRGRTIPIGLGMPWCLAPIGHGVLWH